MISMHILKHFLKNDCKVGCHRVLLTVGLALFALTLQAEEKRLGTSKTKIKSSVPIDQGQALPPTRPGTAEETRKLTNAYLEFKQRTRGDDFSSLENYLAAEKTSPWRISLLHNLGKQYYSTGYLSKAVAVLEEAWESGKNIQEPAVKVIVDDVFGNLQAIHSRLGNVQRLEALYVELGDRALTGSAKTKLLNGVESLVAMKKHPEESFRCGPLALGRLIALKKGSKQSVDACVKDFVSTAKGTSLAQVYEQSQKFGGGYQMVFREPGSEMIVPAVIHWKVGHFGAVASRHGPDQYVIRDSTFIDDLVVSEHALNDEASGYFLVEAGPLPPGWRAVSSDEASKVWGKGRCRNVNDKKTCPKADCGCGGSRQMAIYNVSLLTISLNLEDTPAWYEPGFGPSVDFVVSYHQRDAYQPAGLPYSNLGPLWSHNFVGFVTYNAGTKYWPSTVQVYNRDGGVVDYYFPEYSGSGTPDFEPATSEPDPDDGSILKYYPINDTGSATAATFERIFRDGSKEIYEATDGTASADSRTFISEIKSRQGPGLTLSWSSSGTNMILDSITDAAGKITTLEYDTTPDTLITRVTLPDGRHADFEYHPDGTLKKSIDMGGIASEFSYSRGEVVALTTPYGTTKFDFATTSVDGDDAVDRWLEITDPAGAKERFQFLVESPVEFNDPAENIPSDDDLLATTTNIQYRNTFHWNKKVMKNGGGGDYAQAEIYHWLHSYSDGFTAEPIIESHKKPLENRTFYTYVGQTDVSQPGTNPWPTAAARLVKNDVGSWVTQIYKYEYDDVGNVTKMTDPLGRVTLYEYDTNKQDRTAILVQSGSATQTVWSATYAGPGMPAAVTDASGETTSIAWHSTFKKPTTVTNPKSEVVTYTYDTGTSNMGRLTGLSGDMVGAPLAITYDAKGRADSVTNGSGYELEYTYDNLDRLTQVTYPDNTTETTSYSRLDKQWQKNREGKWTQYFYDSARRLAAVVDPANRVTKFDWCSCGALHGFEDANGNKTSFKQDLQMRVTEREYADGSKITYTYEPGTSRIQKVTDAMLQVKNYTYHLDNNIKGLTYTGTGGGALSPPTPGVTLSVDSVFNRISTMVDGTGTTSYSYGTTGALGALRTTSVDGPLANDTISYDYDELGRIIETQINGSANESTATYDDLGRVSQWTNELGTFTPTYADASTQRLASVEFPNGQVTNYEWENASGDFRLKEIENLSSASAVLSKFNYVTDALSRITQWKQQEGGETAQRYDFSYNPVDELMSGILKNDSTGDVLKEYFYAYDPAGNRTSEQIDSAVRSSTYNNLNQLTGSDVGGSLKVTGLLDEPATVTVGGQSATVTSGTRFEGQATVTSGTNTVTVAATDINANTRTNTYQVIVPGGGSTTITYDANGNMLDDGEKSYSWDAENRLTKITYSDSTSTEFTYDGLSRRVKIVEKDSGGTETLVKNHLWDGLTIAEERDDSNNVIKKFYDEGMQYDGEDYFYTKDHLGSIRELIHGGSTIQAAYKYDPYGRQDESLPTGMKLWLRADAGVTKDGSNKVSAWADQSGNSANGSQANSANQPTWVDNVINGQPVLRFDGTNDHIQGTNNGYNPSGGDYTIFVVHRRSSSAAWTGVFTYNNTSGVQGAPIASWINATDQFGVNAAGISATGVSVNLSGAPSDVYLSTIQRKGGTAGNGGALQVRSVSDWLLLQASGTQSWTSGSSAGYTVGRHWWQAADEHYLNGDVAEVIVYDRSLSPSERSRVDTYLGKKYNRNVVQSDFRYTGHYFHEKSGLSLAPFRAYNSNLGRWISRDPIEENGGANLYGYVSNNPISLWDPFGLFDKSRLTGQTLETVKRAEKLMRQSQVGRDILNATEHVVLKADRNDAGGPLSVLGSENMEASISFNPNNLLGDAPESEKPKIGKCRDVAAIEMAIALAHEGGHHKDRGKMSGVDENRGGTNVRDHENPVRDSLGVPRRMTYGPANVYP